MKCQKTDLKKNPEKATNLSNKQASLVAEISSLKDSLKKTNDQFEWKHATQKDKFDEKVHRER